MKRSLFLLLLLFCFQLSFGQHVKINCPILATAGNETEVKVTSSPVNISKWRIGEIYLVTLPETNSDKNLTGDTSLSVFPNPFRNEINLKLEAEAIDVYRLIVTDITGRQQYYDSEETIIPGQSLKIDLPHLRPAIYILTLYQPETNLKWRVKIQKQ